MGPDDGGLSSLRARNAAHCIPAMDNGIETPLFDSRRSVVPSSAPRLPSGTDWAFSLFHAHLTQTCRVVKRQRQRAWRDRGVFSGFALRAAGHGDRRFHGQVAIGRNLDRRDRSPHENGVHGWGVSGCSVSRFGSAACHRVPRGRCWTDRRRNHSRNCTRLAQMTIRQCRLARAWFRAGNQDSGSPSGRHPPSSSPSRAHTRFARQRPAR